MPDLCRRIWHWMSRRLGDQRGSIVTEYSGIMAVGLIIIAMLGGALTLYATGVFSHLQSGH